MAMKDMEFRGISIEHLGMYFEELGAKRSTDTFPYIYSAEGWGGQLLSEKELSFTAVFTVNSVVVRFMADNEDCLTLLIKNYRFKTTRIGG